MPALLNTITLLFLFTAPTRQWPVEHGRTVDGDTVDVRIDLGFEIELSERIRLADIDTPELYRGSKEERARGRAAKDFADEWYRLNAPLVLVGTGDRGKYGRVIGKICREDGSECVSDALREEGHVK